jgi:hypothetical protein
MDDLDRTMRSLECDIAAEEERAGIFDRADVAYPVMAIALATRRDNLKVTIASLAKGLATNSDGHQENALGWGARAEPAPLVDCRAWEARW